MFFLIHLFFTSFCDGFDLPHRRKTMQKFATTGRWSQDEEKIRESVILQKKMSEVIYNLRCNFTVLFAVFGKLISYICVRLSLNQHSCPYGTQD